MSRSLGLALFLGVFLTLLLGVHYFLWARLIRDPHWPRLWSIAASTVLVAAALSIPANVILNRASPGAIPWLIWPAYIWMGLMFLLFTTLLGVDLIRLGVWLARRAAAAQETPAGAATVEAASALDDVERRQLFARWIAGGAGLLASSVGLAALRSALGPVSVKRTEVAIPKLGKRHDGLTVVQLTDLHVGPTIGRHQIEDIVERTNALAPDIVAITGDLVDGSVDELREAVAPLGMLKAKFGVFFVTGNHEYYSGATAWVDELTRLGIRVLRNERVLIGGDSPGAAAIELAGIDDHSAARSSEGGHGADLPKALRGWDGRTPMVLLAHQPRAVLEAARLGVHLQISGHTHGGQIWPFGALVRLQQQFLAGLGRHGDTWIYVSRGTGYWGPPMRLGAPSEIAQIVLRSREV